MLEDLMEWTAELMERYAVGMMCITLIAVVAVGVTRLVYG